MRIRTIGLLVTTAALAAACGPAPGSPEWCKAAIEGTIKPTEAESAEHGQKCAMQMMQEMMKGLQMPAQPGQ